MKLKLDENLGHKARRLFHQAGHDVHGVIEECLGGCSDLVIYETCLRETRCLVTLDLDFADVLRFPPWASAGIVVIRIPKAPNPAVLDRLLADCLSALAIDSPDGRLWIVEAGRVRVHQGLDPRE